MTTQRSLKNRAAFSFRLTAPRKTFATVTRRRRGAVRCGAVTVNGFRNSKKASRQADFEVGGGGEEIVGATTPR